MQYLLRFGGARLNCATLGSHICICEVQPVDRISIEAMDDIDEFAVASGEGSRVRERQGGRQA